MTNTQTSRYLQTFFAEKNLSERTYEITVDGTWNMISSDMVIDLLLNQASATEQAQAAAIIRKIDFANGDVHHFLKHLATGFVATHGGL